MKKSLLILLMIVTVSVNSPAFAAKLNIMELPIFERTVFVIKKSRQSIIPKTGRMLAMDPRVLPGESYHKGCQLTEAQADILLRKDLRKFCSLYSQYGKDSVLLGALAYNIGPGAVNKSFVLKLLKSGNRNIFRAHTAHCHYHGKFHKGLHSRRLMELGVSTILNNPKTHV